MHICIIIKKLRFGVLINNVSLLLNLDKTISLIHVPTFL